jgi:hypothetical protein
MPRTSIEYRVTSATWGAALLLASGANTAQWTAAEMGALALEAEATVIGRGDQRSTGTSRDAELPGVSRDAELARMLAALAADAFVPFRADIVKRLAELRHEALAEGTENDLRAASLLGFHQFLRYSMVRTMPFVTLTHGGELYATWSEGKERLLSLRFFSPDDVAYVLFRPGDAGEERRHGRSRTTEIGRAVDLQALDWVETLELAAAA